MPESRPLRADARRNRDAIVAAAREAFDQDAQLRFDDFAARAGVGVGTLYRHFPTRAALAAAVYEGEVATLCAEAQDPARTSADNLVAFLRGFVEHVVAHTGLARALAAFVDPDVQRTGGGELERTVAELLTRAVADGDMRDGVPVGAVMVVLHGIGSSTDRPHWPSEARAAVEVLVAGLRNVA
ncbi:TetR family transcriptional regulator [Plantibacter sp. Leaf171]|uniref:TetR/AcrR family transcriptional regulator n=1 Tax=unclassified Plantibacter TaxID=2624265 RepID=UPI0006FA81DF|nr:MULTISPECIES: TetR/AcrR family transcriptional regulator [unclassified Plantibacter]KQM16780.1 TetR family transcriptional regulator [Plantibacter sp. Leaf1]KQQ52881.1 TetR family transcriptional regulator [Plantibacter sp. Leaf314]KQR59916.1 TetR family transcriptional regulator [Plantibacter sp. Leaf171]